MRDKFLEISSGWTLYSGIEDLTDRIERLAKFAVENRPLQPDEEATVKLMIECQIARGLDEFGPDPIFTNCNVCGIKLRYKEEYEMGMCERCADE